MKDVLSRQQETPSAVRLVAPVRSLDPQPDLDLLRFTTAGSVDDGKSTLIGRLLYDTNSILQDRLAAIERASRRRGSAAIELALLTDGLRAEREQNITIDVAYHYFSTPKRRFIIADTPGHVQYTRNMVTGASTAQLAIVLLDARKGVLTQSRRHGFIASLLQVPHVVVAINKMDLVGYDERVFERIAAEYRAFAEKLDVESIVFIPISALHGDHIVEYGDHMAWYNGATLLHHLETVKVSADRNLHDFRFPVQHVIRPHQDFRGFAGRIASGTIAPAEEVVVLPSGRPSRVRTVEPACGELDEASAGDSVVLTLEDEIDVSRGDMIVRRNNVPTVERRFDAMLCWLSDTAMDPRTPYVLMHTTRRVQAYVSRLFYRIDVDTLHREDAATLRLNDIGRAELSCAQPLFFDAYRQNRATGSFILIDPYSHATVAAGIIRGTVSTSEARIQSALEAERPRDANVVWEEGAVSTSERSERAGHRPAVLWFTGLPGSGKSTVARALERALFDLGCQTFHLDGDRLRKGLSRDVGFNEEGRAENLRRAGEVARLFYDSGAIVLCSFVSPLERHRLAVRERFPGHDCFEIFIDCSLEECRRRDPKGQYARAEAGEIKDFTGVSAPYERPTHADLVVDTEKMSVEAAVTALLDLMRGHGILRK